MLNYILELMIYIPWFILGLMLCYFKTRKWIKRRKNCTEKVQVKVIEILSKRGGRGGVIHKPIFKVCSLRKEIIIDSALYTNLYSFDVGQVLWIYVNPNDLQDFMFESPYIVIIMLADGVACLLPFIAILLCFALSKK